MKRARTADGFTLIELLIVVADHRDHRRDCDSRSVAGAVGRRRGIGDRIAAQHLQRPGDLFRDVRRTATSRRRSSSSGRAARRLDEAAGFIGPDLGSAETVVKSRYMITMAGAAVGVAPEACTGLAAGRRPAATGHRHAGRRGGWPPFRGEHARRRLGAHGNRSRPCRRTRIRRRGRPDPLMPSRAIEPSTSALPTQRGIPMRHRQPPHDSPPRRTAVGPGRADTLFRLAAAWRACPKAAAAAARGR